MKKIPSIILATVVSLTTTASFACQKGYTLQGGTGSYHKGGTCVAMNGKTKIATSKANLAQATSAKTSTMSSKPVALTTDTHSSVKTVTNPLAHPAKSG